MSLIYLLDTNTISEPLKPFPNDKVIKNLAYHHNKIALPVFAIYELLKGAYSLPESKKRERICHYIEKTISELPVLLYTANAAKWHGQKAAGLQGIGKTPPFIDAQIAAIAQTNNLILVTRNTSDFAYCDDVVLENWFA